MDDLKLIGKTEEEIQKQKQVFRTFSGDIHTEFVDLTSVQRLYSRKENSSLSKFNIDFNTQIQELAQGKSYKHLGIEESEGLQH
jgi:hypothetical protein